MSWRLRLHYHAELHLVTGQSPEDTDSHAEPRNQERIAFERFLYILVGPAKMPTLLSVPSFALRSLAYE